MNTLYNKKNLLLKYGCLIDCLNSNDFCKFFDKFVKSMRTFCRIYPYFDESKIKERVLSNRLL